MGLRCARCGARLYIASPDSAECLCCGEQVALVSRATLAARRQVIAVARADAARWLAQQPKRGRPRRVVSQ